MVIYKRIRFDREKKEKLMYILAKSCSGMQMVRIVLFFMRYVNHLIPKDVLRICQKYNNL